MGRIVDPGIILASIHKNPGGNNRLRCRDDNVTELELRLAAFCRFTTSPHRLYSDCVRAFLSAEAIVRGKLTVGMPLTIAHHSLLTR